MTRLKTAKGLQLLSELGSPLRRHLEIVDLEVGCYESQYIVQALAKLSESKSSHINSTEEILNEIFILEKFAQLFLEYGRMWLEISQSNFSESWVCLQNAFDLIRIIRRFSGLNVSAIENQLYALESAYPYNIFFSVGAVVEQFDCSICGQDIDSFECIHRKGELYRGEIAYGIARNISHFDHVAMVEHPADKRCVISYPNDAPQFSVVRYLAGLVSTKKILISKFGGISWQKIKTPNPDHLYLRRNDLCYCQSGRKFKKCCIANDYIERDHAEIFSANSIIQDI